METHAWDTALGTATRAKTGKSLPAGQHYTGTAEWLEREEPHLTASELSRYALCNVYYWILLSVVLCVLCVHCPVESAESLRWERPELCVRRTIYCRSVFYDVDVGVVRVYVRRAGLYDYVYIYILYIYIILIYCFRLLQRANLLYNSYV